MIRRETLLCEQLLCDPEKQVFRAARILTVLPAFSRAVSGQKLSKEFILFVQFAG
jgi:hypothetical protein